jgi:NAD(P)-dependent dehydrogenase (short-subunit alcohol dehydrogenase family)
LTANQIFNLEGKVALITGASKGIGEAIARYYALPAAPRW